MLADYSHKIVRTRISDPNEPGLVQRFHSISQVEKNVCTHKKKVLKYVSGVIDSFKIMNK